jgi:Phage integrase family
MPTLLEVYHQLCTFDPSPIPLARRKDFLTALNYLAASYDTTPDVLPVTSTLEAEYRTHLRPYLQSLAKGHSTIRNTLQTLAQLWKAMHATDRTPPIRPIPQAIPGAFMARKYLGAESPYRRISWMALSRYHRPLSAWPEEIAQRWKTFERQRRHRVRASTRTNDAAKFSSYVSYLLMTPDERLAKLPEPAQALLHTNAYADDADDITTPPLLTQWDELFQIEALNSFLTWHAWRAHPWDGPEPLIPPARPSRPSSHGRMVVQKLGIVAHLTQHPAQAAMYELYRRLPHPKKMHDKRAPMHRFELAELEHIAQAVMAEARRMYIDPNAGHPGAVQAIHFGSGLILALAWRNPMRARHWCEALLGKHLKQEEGHWHWHFEGEELKVGTREHGAKVNVFTPDVSPDVVPWLEEYLQNYRPNLPNAAHDPHVFLSRCGRPLTLQTLNDRLRTNVYRYTGKRLYPHLLRSIFVSQHLTHGVDINSVAHGLNDTPATVLAAYNELQADKHRSILQAANQRALATGQETYTLTPPAIPLVPRDLRPPRTPKADEDNQQLALI